MVFWIICHVKAKKGQVFDKLIQIKLFRCNYARDLIYRDIQKIEPLIRTSVPVPQKIYRMTNRLQTPEEVDRYFPGFLSFTDSTEQPIPRRVDEDRIKMYYSGKKKKHAVKTQLMVNNRGIIIHKVDYKKGK